MARLVLTLAAVTVCVLLDNVYALSVLVAMDAILALAEHERRAQQAAHFRRLERLLEARAQETNWPWTRARGWDGETLERTR